MTTETAADTATWRALGTTALVRVSDPRALERARIILEAELEAIDLAASRFRDDSEIERVNDAAGEWVNVSPLALEAVEVALRAAAATEGAVDPTLGAALIAAGYERDWDELEHADQDDELPAGEPRPARMGAGERAWEFVQVRHEPPSVRIPGGVRLDLGATAKAFSAQRAASAATAATGAGVLVSLGGDIAIAGPAPEGGWAIRVTDDHRSDLAAPGQTIALSAGGLATSSTTVRRWIAGGTVMHHIIDPATGLPARSVWRTVSVAAGSCVEANIASTATIVKGVDGLDWLRRQNLPARLVTNDGEVHYSAGWPAADENGSAAS